MAARSSKPRASKSRAIAAKVAPLPTKYPGFSWCVVDTTTRMSLRASRSVAHGGATAVAAALLRAQPVKLFGNFGGGRVDGEQAFQLLDGQVRLAGLRIDLGEVLGGGPVAFVQLQRPAQLRDGRPAGPRVRGRLTEQRPPEGGAEVGLVRYEAGRLAQRLDGLVVAACLQVLEADVVQGAGRSAGW